MKFMNLYYAEIMRPLVLHTEAQPKMMPHGDTPIWEIPPGIVISPASLTSTQDIKQLFPSKRAIRTTGSKQTAVDLLHSYFSSHATFSETLLSVFMLPHFYITILAL